MQAPRAKGFSFIMPYPVSMGPYKDPLLQALQPMEEQAGEERLRSNTLVKIIAKKTQMGSTGVWRCLVGELLFQQDPVGQCDQRAM